MTRLSRTAAKNIRQLPRVSLARWFRDQHVHGSLRLNEKSPGGDLTKAEPVRALPEALVAVPPYERGC